MLDKYTKAVLTVIAASLVLPKSPRTLLTLMALTRELEFRGVKLASACPL